MATADTNILLRWLLDDVPKQTAAADALLNGNKRCLVPDVALVETVFVLERVMRLPRTTIKQLIDALLTLANVDADRSLWRTALADYLRHPKLSIADTYLTTLAEQSGQSPLYTFDRKLSSQLDAAQLL